MKLTTEIVFRELEKLNDLYSQFVDFDKLKNKANAWMDKFHHVDPSVFVKACRCWDKEKFPTWVQIRDRCMQEAKSAELKNNHANISAGDLICDHHQYFLIKNFEQSATEAEMCMMRNSEQVKNEGMIFAQTNSVFAKKFYGFVLCPWHQALARARHHPGASDDAYCKMRVEFHTPTHVKMNFEMLNGSVFKKI